jgi:beta-1,4-mannosyl-glycoprotein beta-1,4-N-acetylglucosaminyltransferase
MLLELRLETLWDHVDFFVISEATYTQVGKPKPLNFDIRRFDKYKSKIRYVAVENFAPGPPSFWKNENYQRNRVADGLFDADKDDLILVSDLDEIPRPETIGEYDPKRYKRGDFEQRAFAYYVNNQLMDGERPARWYGSKITTFGHLTNFFGNASAVRSYKSQGVTRRIRRWWFRRFDVQVIADGGWHFTWVLPPEGIVAKMEAIAEQEVIKEEYKQADYIRRKIDSGEDLLNPKSTYRAQEIVEPHFPRHLVRNKDSYRKWLRPTS